MGFFLPPDVSIVIDLFLGRNKLSILLEQYFFQSGPNLKARAISRKKKKDNRKIELVRNRMFLLKRIKSVTLDSSTYYLLLLLLSA